MKDSDKAFSLIESWEDTNIELGLQLLKGNKELKAACEERYGPIYQAMGKKSLAGGLRKITSKWEKLKNKEKAALIKAWPKDMPFLPLEGIAMGANYNVNRWRETSVSNQISQLPNNLSVLQTAKTFVLDHNLLTTVPPSIGEMEALEYLSIEDNELEKLPEALGKLKQLKYLNLSSNYPLKVLPESIGELTALERLNLEYCNIEKLPASIFELKNLQSINLSSNAVGNDIEFITALMDALPNCQISCSAARSIKAQREKGKIEDLDAKVISFRRMDLFALPEDIFKTTQLEELDLSNNDLRTLPENFGDLAELKKLNLHDNRDLAELPLSFGKLVNLEELILGRTDINKLPESIGELVSLKVLDMTDQDGLRELPPNFGNLENLEKLLLKDASLQVVPEDLSGLKKLEHLRLSYNDFYKFAAAWGTIPNLKILELKDSRSIKESYKKPVPEAICNFTKLEQLELEWVEFSALPEGISALQQLKKLQLSRVSKLDNLPAGLYELKNLESLIIFATKVPLLDEKISNLQKLRKLSLRSNALSEIPESIGKMKALVSINLQSNQLDSLPESITELPNLKDLYLYGNPLSKDKSYMGKLARKMKDCKVHKKESYAL